MAQQKASTLPTRAENYSEWYNELVKKAELAEHSEVRGCMVIKPYGYAIWERIQRYLDERFKETGHVNAYFPLFIPKSLFEAEEKNAEGFAKECAVVTHYRLKTDPKNPGKLIVDPEAKLEEELVVRPTSEAIIWSTYKNWIQSYRDLPLLINQWANVVRWEMRTRIFLRTAEFLWQEGHTAHATAEEAWAETNKMLGVYAEFAEKVMAMPVIRGQKSESERFAGADETLCIEAMMQDGKALQAGTSHFLGQNFAKAFEVKFASKENKEEYVWATSWGVSTRLMGALIMAHSDDQGLVLPPALAPYQVVLIPIFRKRDDAAKPVLDKTDELAAALRAAGIRVKIDDDESKSMGWRVTDWELKGVPVRLALGARDLENGTIEMARRDTGEKTSVSLDGLVERITGLMDEIQQQMYDRAFNFREANIRKVDTWEDFKAQIEQDIPGFMLCHWDGTPETEEKIKEETRATIRCIPFDSPEEDGVCVYSGKPSKRRVVFAKAY